MRKRARCDGAQVGERAVGTLAGRARTRPLRGVLLLGATLGLTDVAASQSREAVAIARRTDGETIALLSHCVFGRPVDVYLVPIQARVGSVLPRWRTPDDGSPRTITIFFDQPPVSQGAGYRWAIDEALEYWTRVPGLRLRFAEAATRETADVTVRWHVTFLKSRGGLTTWRTDIDGWIQKAYLDIVLLAQPDQPFEKPFLRPLARQIARHEVGHVLGLPHSDHPSDLMHPTSRRERLSVRDRQTLQLLYAVEPRALLRSRRENGCR